MKIACVTAIATACVAAGVLAAVFAEGTRAQASAAEPLPQQRGFGAFLSTDKAVYRPGQPIRITFEVFNHTPTPVRFDFNSGQRFDVVVRDGQGKEVWRWSAGRLFTMALGQESLGPARPRLTYEAVCTAELEPGRYRITAFLTDVRRRLSATLRIEVQ